MGRKGRDRLSLCNLSVKTRVGMIERILFFSSYLGLFGDFFWQEHLLVLVKLDLLEEAIQNRSRDQCQDWISYITGHRLNSASVIGPCRYLEEPDLRRLEFGLPCRLK